MAVETGFDTDCNGATVGSIVGMMYGVDNIEPEWTIPLNGVLKTQILGHDKSTIEALIEKTLEHIKKYN
jgi:ADP-ribosylglycohydrolase